MTAAKKTIKTIGKDMGEQSSNFSMIPTAGGKREWSYWPAREIPHHVDMPGS